MTLPHVSGWMIDYRTAREIFISGSNNRISHCVGLCGTGLLGITHCEEKQFKSDGHLRSAFIDENNCVIIPDADIADRCRIIAGKKLRKQRLVGNDTAVFMAGIAASRNYGVISNHASSTFSTVVDICHSVGIPAYSADEYFSLVL